MRRSITVRVLVPIVLTVLLVAVAIAALPRVGELGPIDGRIAAAHSALVFDAATWQNGSMATRGAMLSDLMRRHTFVGKHRDSVIAILGPGKDCRIYYHDEPCYGLRLGHSFFELRFPLDHSDHLGYVLDVDLVGR